MQLQIGKRYVTRDGRVTEAVEANDDGFFATTHPFWASVGLTGCSWTGAGMAAVDGREQTSRDLVAEFFPATVSQETSVQPQPTVAPSPAPGVQEQGENKEPLFMTVLREQEAQARAEAASVKGALSLTEQFDAAGAARTTAERGAIYGHPADDFDRAARLKAVVAECPDPRIRHALDMICVKIARLIETPGHLDSWIDISGYARTGVMVLDAKK